MASVCRDVISEEDGKARGESLSFSKAFLSTLRPQARNYLYFIGQKYDIWPLLAARGMGK